jgi:putative transposase
LFSKPRLRLGPIKMTTISKDDPCLFITTVARNRLPVFRTDTLKNVACKALDEARRSGGFRLFAYVIMPEHLHVVADGTLKASDTLRYVNGILGHRVIAYLKKGKFTASLEKLRTAPRGEGQEYSLVDHHPNALPVFSESFFMQKVNYIHLNPVRAGLVERAEDYRWSSARCWSGRPAEDEPLRMDLEEIVWRRVG